MNEGVAKELTTLRLIFKNFLRDVEAWGQD
jgi:hypothetical protein